MKKLLLFIISSSLYLSSTAQTPLSHKIIEKVPGASRDEIYTRARKWFSESFNDMKSVLDVQDKESGELIGSFTFRFKSTIKRGSSCSKGTISSNISVFVKEGKYKIVFANPVHHPEPDFEACSFTFDYGQITDSDEAPRIRGGWGKKWGKETWEDMKKQTISKYNSMAESLKKAMSTSNDNDW